MRPYIKKSLYLQLALAGTKCLDQLPGISAFLLSLLGSLGGISQLLLCGAHLSIQLCLDCRAPSLLLLQGLGMLALHDAQTRQP